MPKIITAPISKYIQKWQGKKTVREMAKDLGVSYCTVRNYAIDSGFSLDSPRSKLLSDTISKHGAEMTVTEIVRMLNASPRSVKKYGKRLGIEFKEYEYSQPKAEPGFFFDESARLNWLV